jgi:hypothetical protein
VSGTLEEQDSPGIFTPVPVGEIVREPPRLEGKPRSGYARIRAKFHHLIAKYQELESEYVALRRHHEALKVGHEELQSAFDELLSIHNGLLADLKQSHQARSAASNMAGLGLMGRSHV